MMGTNKSRRRSGLTLIELIVALATTGTALSAGYGALAWMGETRRRTERETQAVWHAAAVRRTIATWLAGATLAVSSDVAEFRGVHGECRGERDDAITFRTTAPTSLGTSETVITLFIDRDESTPERGLVARLREPHGTRQGTVELEPNASSLAARYLSGVSGHPQWTSSWISSSVLPRGIEFVIEPSRAGALPPLLALAIVVPFASGM